MRVQIVMPAINLWNAYTRAAIESVNTAMVRAADHGIPCRLLLVDNASTDETSEEASKLVSDVFCHQRNEERWSFSKSVNFGVRDAFERGYDLVLVVNNDITLHPEAIWRLVGAFGKERERPTAMVTCLDVRGEVDEKGFAPAQIGELVAHDKEECEEAEHPCFSAFMVSQAGWEEVGEFDEAFAPAYFEDNDYHRRINLSGMMAVAHPAAMFYHYGSKTSQEAGEPGRPVMTSPQFEKNRAVYVGKWGGLPGQETYEHPYNNPAFDWRHTKQSTT